MSEAMGWAASGFAGTAGFAVALWLAWACLDLFFRVVPPRIRAAQPAESASVRLRVIAGGKQMPRATASSFGR
jgi:hypothetical protein